MMIDDRLRTAADDLLHQLELTSPPTLPEPHRRSLVVVSGAALVATATVVGLIVVASHGRSDTTVGTTAVQPVDTTQDTVESANTIAQQREFLQLRIDQLQREVDALTLQIQAILAQGDAGSQTELQVLQQRQSLTIRDLADARDRLTDLDLVGADPLEQREVLQARMDDLQKQIDDLTLQIEALLSQGGSETETQVLQQQQSLAIRDQADVRGRLADLDLVDASMPAKRQLLLARLGELQGRIDQLTAQINAVLAQGDDGSTSDLQVLQQQQSLAIRDLAAAQEQFNALPPVDGPEATLPGS